MGKVLLCEREDWSQIPIIHVKSTLTIYTLGGRDKRTLDSLESQSGQSASSGFRETLTHKIRWRVIEKDTQC